MQTTKCQKPRECILLGVANGKRAVATVEGAEFAWNLGAREGDLGV